MRIAFKICDILETYQPILLEFGERLDKSPQNEPNLSKDGTEIEHPSQGKLNNKDEVSYPWQTFGKGIYDFTITYFTRHFVSNNNLLLS